MKLSIEQTLTIALAIAVMAVAGCTTNTSTNAIRKPPLDSQAQSEIKIGANSSTYPAMKILTDAYAAKVKNTKLTFLLPNQSESAIALVKDGLLEIAIVSKQLLPEENNDTLEYQEVAKDALLVATHKSVTNITNLTTDNLKAIYSGAVKNWQELGGPDAKIVVLGTEDDSAKRLLRKYYLGQQLKNSPSAVILRYEGDVIAAVQNTPYSIGTFSLGYAIYHNSSVNRLSLNGVEATSENVKEGKYQMVRTISVVSQKSSAKAKKFIDFALSAEAAEALGKFGFVPSR